MKKMWLILAASFSTLALGFACLMLGDIHLSFIRVLAALFGQGDHIAGLVVWTMRLPNVVAALITGAALATSGLLLQRLTNNPLVDSSILGVNAGASLGAVTLITLANSHRLSVQRWLPLAAISGACLALVIVRNRGTHSRLLLLLRGVALTALLNGIILLLQLNMNTFDFERVLTWLSGSFWNTDWAFLSHYGTATIGLLLAVAAMQRPLAALILGDDMAHNVGVNVLATKRWLLGLAIALAAVAVAVGGAISLVGLMAPNIAKYLCGNRFSRLFPITILLGCGIMLAATAVANNLFLPSTLPVGLVVAVITMPYFLFQLFHD